MNDNLLDRIEENPEIMFGKPIIKGTRLTVEIILEKLAYGESVQSILNDYPILDEEDVKASLLFAAKTVSLEEIILV